VSADLPVESTRQAAALLLPLGADAEVVGPPELRAELAATAAAMAALYRGEPAGPAAGLT
jgi:predicted DNA-binding transcriptional regulator YafY